MNVKELKEVLKVADDEFAVTILIGNSLHHIIDADTFAKSLELRHGKKLTPKKLLI